MGSRLAARHAHHANHLRQIFRVTTTAAFAIADNCIAELPGWNDKLLAKELKALLDSGYDLNITGFTTADLHIGPISEDFTEKHKAVELPDPEAVAISREGDLWRVGPHRLYCGNSRDPKSFEIVLGCELATMIFSDGPYNVPIVGHVSGLGKVQHREFAEAVGEMSPAEFTAFQRIVMRNCARFSSRRSIHYHCMDWKHMREILDAADGVYAEFKQLVVWQKDNAGMGTFYRSQHELMFVFKSGKGKHINNFGLGQTGRYRTNVWSYAGANTFRKGRAEDLAAHPTVKNLALVADAILDCSNRGDLILDPFSGSGTTLAAAHHTGRRGAAIELDPLYVDTGLRRLCATSGLTAIHADGRSFDAVAADRANQREMGND